MYVLFLLHSHPNLVLFPFCWKRWNRTELTHFLVPHFLLIVLFLLVVLVQPLIHFEFLSGVVLVFKIIFWRQLTFKIAVIGETSKKPAFSLPFIKIWALWKIWVITVKTKPFIIWRQRAPEFGANNQIRYSNWLKNNWNERPWPISTTSDDFLLGTPIFNFGAIWRITASFGAKCRRTLGNQTVFVNYVQVA